MSEIKIYVQKKHATAWIQKGDSDIRMVGIISNSRLTLGAESCVGKTGQEIGWSRFENAKVSEDQREKQEKQ